MTEFYPLRFGPILKRYLWGGRRLQSVLGKELPPGDDYAESWELVDHGDDQSVVQYGPLAGATLERLLAAHGQALLGRHWPQPRFPLLFKFLDCNRNLSLQVHPNDDQAAQLDPPDFGKTEAWVILHAEPGAVVYAGLKAGVDRPALERAVQQGRTQQCLHQIEPRQGDCIFIPAGVAHALGAGLVVAEVQQSSDTTFRLFDWNRVGADGKPRTLHVREALEVIDYDFGPVQPQSPQPTSNAHAQTLVACDKFVLQRWEISTPQSLGGDDVCRLVVALEGGVAISGDPCGELLKAGQTALLPASLAVCTLTPQDRATLLVTRLP